MRVIKPYPVSCWRYYNPVPILGSNSVLDILNELTLPDKILLVTTSGFTARGMTAGILGKLGEHRVVVYDQVNSYPELDEIDQITQLYHDAGIQSIIALGGGSVIDLSKILGVTLYNNLDRPLDIALRQNKPQVWKKQVSVIAVPTTSGTGAEVTPFATVWDRTTSKKFSLNSNHLFPDYAVLDCSLTLTLPYRETLYTGLDAISHALETLWNKNRTPISENFAIQALDYAVQAFPIVLKQPGNLKQRKKMQLSSLLAGMAISQTKTAIAHSISYPLTSYYDVPHGLACSFTLVSIINKLNEGGYFKEKGVILPIIEMLNNLHLSNEILNYVDFSNLVNLIPLMITPERSGNFIIPINQKKIEEILEESFEVKYK